MSHPIRETEPDLRTPRSPAAPPVTGRRSLNARARCRLGLFLLFYGLFLASSSGIFLGNPDTVFMWGVARQIARTGEIAVAPEVLTLQPGNFDHLRGKDGRHYFPKGMSYSLALAPFCWLGDALAVAVGVPPDPLMRAPYGMFGASLAGPLFATLEILFIFELCLSAGFELRRSVLAALGAGLGTILWAGSKSCFSEPFMGMLITFQFLCLVRYTRDPALRWIALAAMSFGLVFLSQPAMIVLLGPPLGGLVLWTAWRTHRLGAAGLLRVAAAFGLPIVACAAVLGGLNFMRYGGVTSTGYWNFAVHYIPLYEGLYGVFFSSGKSLFLYSPPLIFAAVGVRSWVRRFGAVALFPVFALALFLGLYGSLPTWHGDGAWGPRYFTPLTGILAVLAAGILAPESATAPRRNERRWIGLLVLGLGVQVIGVTTSTPGYFSLLIDNGVLLDGSNSPAWRPVLYDPQLSPIAGRARLLASRIGAAVFDRSGTWKVYRADWTLTTLQLRDYDGLDLWPSRVQIMIGSSPAIRTVVVTGWIVLLAVAAAGGFLLRPALRADSEPAADAERPSRGQVQRPA